AGVGDRLAKCSRVRPFADRFVQVVIDQSPEEEAVEVIHSELARVRENGLGQEEFDRAKAFLIGEHLRSLQRAGAKASEAAFDTLYGLEREGTDAFRKKIQAVRAEDVLAVARTFLAPEKGAMVRLGPPIRDRRRRRASR
ncbi:MAG: insulinase family protein, partial [Nitrospinota bacterium]|nr:insulinase family protein [Nitrospinota bacterium]